MKFDIYGCFTLEVVREDGRWLGFRLSDGTRRLEHNLVFPPNLDEAGLTSFLDDLYHELARPGQQVRKLV